MRTRAFRIHQQERKKKWAYVKAQEWFGTHEPNKKQVGRLANTPTPCSCHMCGNYRRIYGNSHPLKHSELRRVHELVPIF